MSRAIFWFRKDLRLNDNPGLYYACQNHSEIICLYILDDEDIQAKAQSWWLHHSLKQLQKKIPLILKKGRAQEVLEKMVQEEKISAVYWNRCYEPESIQRDQAIKSSLTAHSFNASLIFEPWEVRTQQAGYFKVFTPFWRQCLKQLDLGPELAQADLGKIIAGTSEDLNDWQLLPQKPNWALQFSDHWQVGETAAHEKLHYFISQQIAQYKQARDQPALEATSRLGPHLHFGEIGPKQIFRAVLNYQMQHPEDQAACDCFLSELGWREFSYHLLYHFPQLPTNNFKPSFDNFPWKHNPSAFKRWTQGLTGYPIVDAGMRELWISGGMHNRVRMIVASFLVKDLFIDWRQGAAWFEKTLVDADLASNNASWQWVAGSGADAAPYFRIFNPCLQGEKFDPQGLYVKKWLPELAHIPEKWIHQVWRSPYDLGDYPKPMVEHEQARREALSYYQQLKT